MSPALVALALIPMTALIPTQIGSFVLAGEADFFSFSRASRNGADF
jgi:hypothetical protein